MKKLDRAYHIVHNIPMEKPKEVKQEEVSEEKPSGYTANITQEQLGELLSYHRDMLLAENRLYSDSYFNHLYTRKSFFETYWWVMIIAGVLLTTGLYTIIMW